MTQTGDPSILDAIESGQLSLDDALTHYRPPTGGERVQTFGAILGRAARDAYLSGTSAELRLVERGLNMIGADSAAEWTRGFADYVAPGGGFADDVGEATGTSLDVPEAAQNEQSAVARAFTQLLPEGLGSSLGMVALPGLKGVGGIALKGALVGGGQQFVEAKAEGADDATAWAAFAGGAGLGATDAIPLGRILGRADAASGGKLTQMLWEGVVKSGFEEGTQETLQTIGENLLAGALYDEDRAVIENVLDSGTGGALTGMLIGALAGAVGGRARGGASAEKSQEVPGSAEKSQPGPAVQPDAEATAAMEAVGATEIREAGPELKRFAPEGARVYTGRGEMRRPAVTLGNTVIVDESKAGEALVDHEIGGHLAREVQSQEERAAFLEAVDAVDPTIRATSLEEYAQDELATRRRELGRDITPEEEAQIRAAIPDEEGIARVFEDLSPVVRALRTNPDALSRIESPAVWKRIIRAVADLVKRATGGKPTPHQRADAALAWKLAGGSERIDPETGRKLAGLLGGYLEGVAKGRVQAPGIVEEPASTAIQTPSTAVQTPETVPAAEESAIPETAKFAAERRKQTESPEFRRWFGASKVVDGEGKPLVVYHGTRKAFSEFDKGKLGSNTGAQSAKLGFFFTTSPEVAGTYPDGLHEVNRADAATFGGGGYMPSSMEFRLPQAEAALQRAEDSSYRVISSEDEPGKFEAEITEYDEYGTKNTYNLGYIYDDKGEARDAAEEELEKERGKLEAQVAKYAKRAEAEREEAATGSNIAPVYLKIENPLVYDLSERGYGDVSFTAMVKEAIEEGHDGLVMIDVDDAAIGSKPSDVFVVFDPTQIKSATGNRGTFDAANPDIRYAAARRPDIPAMRAAINAAPDEELERIIRTTDSDPDSAARRILAVYERARRTGDTSTMNEIRKQLGGQDRYATWRRALPSNGTTTMTWDVRDRLMAYAVDAWRAPGRWRDALASAGKVTDANDIVLQENLRRSGTLKVVQDETAAHVVPLRELLAGGPVSLDEAGTYLLARAAPDRNRLILSRGGPADGSGMTDADAQAIVLKADGGPNAARYRDIAAAFDRLTQRKLELMEQYGLLSPEQAAELKAQEPLYAPMKRDPQAERLYGESERPTVGVARTRRREFRSATGRSTVAENPIVYATMDLMAAIERGMWNATTGRATLDMAREFSDPRIALVDVPATQRTVVNGEIREVPAMERENEVVVKENGVPRVVRFGKGWEPVAAAIKGGDKGAGDALLAAIRPATRLLAGLSTRWNPAFQPVNVVRDALGAYLNASADLGPAAAASMVNPRTVASMMKDAAQSGPWSTRFANAGGPVAFLDLARTFEEESKRTIRAIQNAAPPNGPWAMPRKYAAQIVGLLERMGQISENATRMAAFKYAVEELGASDARAAQYAKNITTNFERRGSNAWMSSLYAFSNAGVQGTARVGQALRNPWGQRAAAGLVAGAFVLSYLNRITGGDDDDGVPRWDKIPEWQRRSNAILMVGDTKLMVPMPFVWNIFHALGTEIERGAFGGQTGLESTSAIGSAMAGALNPLGGEADLIDTVTPTLLDPAVQVARNRDYAGRRIFPESRSAQQPDSELAWDTTSPTLQTLASGLNSVSGGDAGTPGLADVSPATLEFLFKQYLGGVGGESSRVLRLAEKLIRDEDVEAQDVPVVRRFVGSLGLAEQRGYYKGRMAQIEKQVLREKAGEPFDANLWRLRKRANRWDERVSELEKSARGATGPDRDRIRAKLRDVFLEATQEIEEATK